MGEDIAMRRCSRTKCSSTKWRSAWFAGSRASAYLGQAGPQDSLAELSPSCRHTLTPQAAALTNQFGRSGAGEAMLPFADIVTNFLQQCYLEMARIEQIAWRGNLCR